jgi:hypothetical protein
MPGFQTRPFRMKNKYVDVGVYSFTDTAYQLQLTNNRSDYVFCTISTAESTDDVVVCKISIYYSSSENDTSNSERLAVWKGDNPLRDLGDLMKMLIVLGRPKKSTSRAGGELRMSQTNVGRIVKKRLRLETYKLQAVQKLTTRDKRLRS